ncbi:alpha/beta fold hydrolase [Caballeronia sordidicola]|uniref:alpha/beta fold hydrolase n=1 Tax=Caballeronia sordidicola TaxID=196367 RepID=UPI00068A803E|nr:alpha/beta hydrolase [Caballeronia sordidicola]
MPISPVSAPLPSFFETLESFPSRLARSSAGAVSFREAGADKSFPTPVVLLHGIGSGAASWVNQLDTLGRSRHVLAWDAPGYGESTPVGPASPIAQDYALALAAWLHAVHIRRCVLVGHSLGAIIAGAFAALHPSKVAGLLLLSPASGYGAASADLRESKREARLSMLEKLGPEGLAEQRSSNMLSRAANEEARLFVRWNMSRILPHGYRQATHLLANADLVSDVARFSGRIAVAVGNEDSITPPTACERIARAARVGLQVVPNAGHAGYVELPDVYASLIEIFCLSCGSCGVVN